MSPLYRSLDDGAPMTMAASDPTIGTVLQSFWPDLPRTIPAKHRVHESWPAEGWNCPAGQLTQASGWLLAPW